MLRRSRGLADGLIERADTYVKPAKVVVAIGTNDAVRTLAAVARNVAVLVMLAVAVLRAVDCVARTDSARLVTRLNFYQHIPPYWFAADSA